MAETTCDKLTAAPISHSYAALREKIEKIRSEMEPSKKARVVEGVLRLGFIYHYPTLILTGSKLH